MNLQSSQASAAGVTVTSPSNGATVTSPVLFKANATAYWGRAITSIVVYVDYKQAGPFVYANTLSQSLTLAAGAHSFLVQAWDNRGTVYKSAVMSLNVQPSSLSASPSGSTVPPLSQLVDNYKNVWTIVNNQVARNGVVDTGTSGVDELLFYNGALYQHNTWNDWYEWLGSSWSGKMTDPRGGTFAPSPSPSPVPVTSGSGAPIQAQNAGYSNLVFSDNFTSLSLASAGTGYTWYNPGIWYEQPATGASTPYLNGGVNLPWVPGQSGTTSIGTMASDGRNYKAWLHGYIEVVMAFTPVTGAWPAIWLENLGATTSYVPAASSTHSYGELDLFEWQSQAPSTFYGTAHTWVGSPVSDVQNNSGHNSASLPSGTNLANFNKYGLLWTPTQISWYFNDKLLFTISSSSYPTMFNVFNSTPMYLMLTNQPGYNWSSANRPSQTINMKVQSVRVWQ